VAAKDLRPGDRLRTPDGQLRAVVATLAWTQQQRVYNLTVDVAHTYYADAGGQDLLVHNAGCGPRGKPKEMAPEAPSIERTNHRGRFQAT
jgi:hypothetical protein